MEECCQKCRKWLFNTWEPVPVWVGTGFSFEKLAKTGKMHAGTGSCMGRNRVPIHFSRSVFWKLSGTGSYICRNRVLLFIFEKCQTLKIHNFQTVSPF